MQHLDDGELTAYLDGQTGRWTDGQHNKPSVSPSARQSVAEQHLAECAECRARLEEMRVTRDRAKAILRSGTPAGTRPAFSEIVARRRAASPAAGIRQLRTLAWAATVVLALGVGWYARDASLREPAPAGPMVVSEAQPPAKVRVDSGPRQRAQAPQVVRDQGRAQGSLRGKQEEKVLAQNDVPAAKAVAVQAPPPPVVVAEEPRLQKKNDTTREALHLDAVVVTGVAAAAESQNSGAGAAAPAANRRARSASAPAAAPAPVAARADVSQPREWTPVDLAEANRTLGRAPLTLPGAPVVSYEVRFGGASTVKVTQRMPTGVLELIERIPGTRSEAAPSGMYALVEGLEVFVTGPGSYDSLRALVGRLR